MMGGSYKRSWRMLNKLRKAFRNQDVFTEDNGVYEADEVYCNAGLRPENITDKERYSQAVKAPNNSKTKAIMKEISKISSSKYIKRNTKKGTQGRGTEKHALLGIMNRYTKQVYAKVIPHNEKGQRFTKKRVNSIFKEVIKGQNATVISDEISCYDDLPKIGIRHIVITHKIAYSKEGVNTNSMESFWATIQRMIIGVYHHVSPELLQSYVDECVFRRNQKEGRIFFKENTFEKFMAQTIL